MAKRKPETNEQRLWNIGAANLSEWRRLVIENVKFWAGLSKLRHRWVINGDLRGQEEKDFIKRIGVESMAQLSSELNLLITECGIPEKWRNRAKGLIWQSRETAISITESVDEYGQLGGFPSLEPVKGKLKIEITPDTDIDNPLVQQAIKNIQRLYRPPRPPQPMPIPSNKHGTLDWRPVWEWHNRHPDVTLDKIAEYLHRDSVSVRRAMANLDRLLQK